MASLSNVVYDDINIGDEREYSKQLTRRDVELFAETSGDFNPVHMDEEYAKTTAFGECIGHGMWSGALISAAVANTLPGPGSIYRSQTLKFIRPAKIGDTLTVKMTVTDKKDRIKLVTIECVVLNQHDEKIASGTTECIAPTEPLTVEIKTP